MANMTLPGAEAHSVDDTGPAERLEIKAEQLAALMALLTEEDFSSFFSAGKRVQMSLMFMLHEIATSIEKLSTEVAEELRAAQGGAA